MFQIITLNPSLRYIKTKRSSTQTYYILIFDDTNKGLNDGSRPMCILKKIKLSIEFCSSIIYLFMFLYTLVFKIYFDYGSMGKFDDIIISFVDSKTIFFRTPPCLMLEAERDLMIPIIVTQTDIVIARVDFVYLTCKLS